MIASIIRLFVMQKIKNLVINISQNVIKLHRNDLHVY